VPHQPLPDPEAAQLCHAGFTYREVGATRSDNLPSGDGHLRRNREVGAGAERFEQATRVLLGWDMHRRAGLGVRASDAHVVPGAVAVLRLGIGPVGVDAPVRVAYVVDEPRRRGFAYGTLPGHPESGEEAFVVEFRDDEAVTFTITAFSRPASLLTRVGGPIGRVVQSRVTDRYMRAV
jgi:uncharacterized protein (UPF0548 family)